MSVKYYRLLPNTGSHFSTDGKTEYKAGDVVPSTKDLKAAFIGKFEEVPAPAAVQTPVSAPETPISGQETPVKGQSTTPAPAPVLTGDFGEDATEAFEDAEDNELKVFKKAKDVYFVVDPATPGKALNDEPLKKKEVAGFIKNYLKG